MSQYFRKIIRIRAIDSPNVQRWLQYRAAGLEPVDEQLVPGVLTGPEYEQRLATWDKVRQCIGLDAEFWEGADQLLFPPDWLTRSHRQEFAARCQTAPTEAVGIDPAEGGDKTAMAAVNRWGLKELVSARTPNTATITAEAIAFMRKHSVPPSKVLFDRGGGGKQHADRMKEQGFPVRTAAFGGHPELEMKRGLHMLETRRDVHEQQYVYVNLRAQMYHEASQLLDPAGWVHGFPQVMEGLDDLHLRLPELPAPSPVPGETPEEFEIRKARLLTAKVVTNAGYYLPSGDGSRVCPYAELRRQLAVMPKLTDQEGRYWMHPKDRKDKNDPAKEKIKTLVELIGHSPDEADAFVLGVHAMLHRAPKPKVGVA